ncbi:MAG: hypothetical protein KCHDKBKB_02264 [Elusimicrobia bacterium]|nr:hypothetical protein [Elusimicrobiota bacterium]
MFNTKQPNQRAGINPHSNNIIDGLEGLNGTCIHLLANLIAGSDFLREEAQEVEEAEDLKSAVLSL